MLDIVKIAYLPNNNKDISYLKKSKVYCRSTKLKVVTFPVQKYQMGRDHDSQNLIHPHT